MSKENILIYVDKGASFSTLLQEISFEINHAKAQLIPVLAEDILKHGVLDTASALIMPGGADTPFCTKLNGLGNQLIRNFVNAGGSYLGICAGAYYACSSLSFHAGRSDEISGPRELSFIPGKAIGSIEDFGPHYDFTVKSVSVVPVQWEGFGEFGAYYHGGPMFELSENFNCEVFGRYKLDKTPAAAVSNIVGNGIAVVCGVHLECSADQIESKLAHLASRDERYRIESELRGHDAIRKAAFRGLLERARIPV